MNEKTERQCADFKNRVIKKYRHLKKWAKRTDVTCFRLYDADIPEVPVALDIYEADTGEKTLYGHLALYERTYEKDEAEEDAWFLSIKEAASQALEIPPERIFTKTRKRQKGEAQYEKFSQTGAVIPVRECGARFSVNLSDYVDTGLFFDHRLLRSIVRSECAGKDVLNLFCYTGSFSVYAGLGGAASVDSVDLSKTYLAWAEKNLSLNIPESAKKQDKYRFIHEDVQDFLTAAKNAKKAFRCRWDIIILDPPTFSNSKRAQQNLDINQHWALLCSTCLELLNPGGTLYFSTNSRKLRFDEKLITVPAVITDITAKTIPEDFKDKKPHRCWKLNPR